MISDPQRDHFDRLLEQILAELPDHLHRLLEEVPLIVEDEASEELLRDVGIEPGEGDLCGLHSGVPLTERSVWHDARMPDQMMMFRGPIMRMSGEGAGRQRRGAGKLRQQIQITLLHEIGHHFGLDEDDLDALGYA